jgi:hypothetical protein
MSAREFAWRWVTQHCLHAPFTEEKGKATLSAHPIQGVGRVSSTVRTPLFTWEEGDPTMSS